MLREKEMLRSVSKGLRYKEIVNRLNTGLEIIRTHTLKIYEKLQVQSRKEAINKIIRH